MNGIIIIDKPADWTSHDVVAKLRGALKEKRIGHGGTLDPMATGVLPIFIGRATRAAEFCENTKKEYIAGLKLGITTDTQDITGKTLHTSDASISPETLISIIPQYLGAIQQIPPMYSAIKQGGKKLYELARKGIEIPRPPRDVCIYDIELLDSEKSEHKLRIVCSKGTYIRTLCHDIGATLGCGGTMSSLRRTKVGTYHVAEAHTLEKVLDTLSTGDITTLIKPIDTIFSEYPAATLDESETRKCKNGAQTHCNVPHLSDGKYRFYCPDNEFILFGEVTDGKIKVIKGFWSTNHSNPFYDF